MSEGPQGVQGHEGVRGLQGPGGGEPGPQGAPGAQGEKGDTGGQIGSRVVLAFVALVVVASLVSLGYWRTLTNVEDLSRRNSEARAALCAFKANLADRERAGTKFLADVRSGARPPVQGISENDLEMSLTAQRATLKALAHLTCE